MPPVARTPITSSTTAPTPTPSSNSSVIEEDRISPLPVFNNPAYESSSDDLENDTASSTVSAEHQHSNTNSINNNNKNSNKSKDELLNSLTRNEKEKSSIDPLEDLRNLQREICPGITLSKANVDHILRIANNNMSNSNSNQQHSYTNPDFSNNEENEDSNNKNKRRNSLTTDNKNQKNISNELCLKMDSKQLSARKGKPKHTTADDLYTNDLEADLKRMTKDYKKAKATKEAAAKESTETKIFGFTLKQLTLFVLFAVANILSGITVSLQAPFYPEVVSL